MKKNYIIGIISIIATAGGILAYRFFVPPSFKIIEYDNLKKTGIYSFGGVENYFGNSTNMTQVGRMGWELNINLKDGYTLFELYNKYTGSIKEVGRY